MVMVTIVTDGGDGHNRSHSDHRDGDDKHVAARLT